MTNTNEIIFKKLKDGTVKITINHESLPGPIELKMSRTVAVNFMHTVSQVIHGDSGAVKFPIN